MLKHCVVDKILVLLLLLQKRGKTITFFYLFSGNSYSGDKPSSVNPAKRCLSSELPQWGSKDITARASTSISFPIAFSSVYSVLTAGSGVTDSGDHYNYVATVLPLSATNNGFVARSISEDGCFVATKVAWLAVGK